MTGVSGGTGGNGGDGGNGGHRRLRLPVETPSADGVDRPRRIYRLDRHLHFQHVEGRCRRGRLQGAAAHSEVGRGAVSTAARDPDRTGVQVSNGSARGLPGKLGRRRNRDVSKLELIGGTSHPARSKGGGESKPERRARRCRRWLGPIVWRWQPVTSVHLRNEPALNPRRSDLLLLSCGFDREVGQARRRTAMCRRRGRPDILSLWSWTVDSRAVRAGRLT